ncbi:MAG: hypothetical protein FVQ80_18145 [Planctomycetes bacterium]|nr:hypothetical protein [Planctomycetota bacterium]
MTDTLEYFKDPLKSILFFLKHEDLPHVIIGGIAVSQLSYPRATADIDVLAILDKDRIVSTRREFAAALEMPEIIDDLLKMM